MSVADLDVDYEAAGTPNLPPPPADSTCVLIQRGLFGATGDADIGLGNGLNWPTGSMPYSWTGNSPYQHWSAYQFDISAVPANANVTMAVFTTYAAWNSVSTTVRAHRILNPWAEATVTYKSFTNSGTITNWSPTVLGTFDPKGGGFRSVNVTGLVQDWVGGLSANAGLLLEENNGALHMYFGSESGTVDRRPSLFVCWSNVPACGELGEGCSESVPCCDEGAICNDGVCEEGGGECAAVATACQANAECCSGACFDGVCISTDSCVPIDSPTSCNPMNPCCDGAHCVLGTCFSVADIPTCSPQGQSCDPDNGMWCCWSMLCGETGQCE
ncbi:MAG: DNRLRE domain-containing protein [Polyangiaceae bacterium]|nr:DNRLRE domain-containing protein [Polyangiaceae bacterium]